MVEPFIPARKARPSGGRPRLGTEPASGEFSSPCASGIPWEMLRQELGCGSGMTCWHRLRDCLQVFHVLRRESFAMAAIEQAARRKITISQRVDGRMASAQKPAWQTHSIAASAASRQSRRECRISGIRAETGVHSPGIQWTALPRNIFRNTGRDRFRPWVCLPPTLSVSLVAKNLQSRT